MSSNEQNSGKARSDPKPQAEKKEVEREDLTEQELRAVSGGYVIHGQKPPPPTSGWNPQG